MPVPDRSELPRISEQLEGKTPQEILRWAVETYSPRLTMATAFGAEGCCILHMLAEIEPPDGTGGPPVHVFNLETGYQFRETLELRDRIAERYGIEVELVQPELDIPTYEAQHGGPLYKRDPNQCCFDRKVVPLRKVVARGFDAWISAIRRDTGGHRAHAPVVAWDQKFELAKVNPLVRWTKSDVWSFILKNDIPYNPLHDQGYPSIGCWPCTQAVGADEDERAGRWRGFNKTECGLHVVEPSVPEKVKG